MNKNHVIKFVVSKDQKQRIEANAHAAGYVTISRYLRDLSLNFDKGFLHRFNDLHDRLMKGSAGVQPRPPSTPQAPELSSR